MNSKQTHPVNAARDRSGSGSVARNAWWLPTALGLAIVAMAPFWGSVALPRLEEALGSSGLRTALTVLFALAGVALVVWALRRIRERRAQRFGLLTLAILLVLAQALTSGRDEAAVERVHFVLYGLVALLFVRAFTERGWLALPLAMVCSALIGIADEWVQWLVPVRVGDIFDVGLNLYAAACGAIVGWALFPPHLEHPTRRRRARWELALASSVFVAAVAAFLQAAHLGHRIVDPELGTLRSFFTSDELDELNERRLEQWGGFLPPPLRALEVEDYFRSEAGWHVLARNRAREAGDRELAWREEQILRRYYPTFLDLKRRNGDFYYRLPPEELAALAESFPAADPTYVSRADNGRIWIAPRPWVLWTLVATWTLAAFGICWRVEQREERGSVV